MILSVRVVDLVAGATLVGVLGGGALAVTHVTTPAYPVAVSSPVVGDPAPPAGLVSADPFVRAEQEPAREPDRAVERSSASGAATGAVRPPVVGLVPPTGIGVAGTSEPAPAGGSFAPAPAGGAFEPAPAGRTSEPAPAGRTSEPTSAGGTASASGSRPSVTTDDIVVSSFNVLGGSHTRGKGRKAGFAPGPTRATYAAQLIEDRNVDLVGLQELEGEQARVVVRHLPGYDIYPGPQKRRHASSNSIMWRLDTWRAVETRTVGIPYFHGKITAMPYVRLRNVATGTDVWVANFHNPASTKRRGNQTRWRAEATRRQVDLANRLRDETGLPVIFTGDFNERDVYFCRLVGATELEASNGGSVSDGHCSPPRDMRIDWIFGTPELRWRSSVADKSDLVRRTTDHPMVVATAQLRAGVGYYSEPDRS